MKRRNPVSAKFSRGRSRSSRRAGGFTLIELLVVIAIIALLISIMMPALAKAKRLAMRVTCGGQLRSFYLGLRVYAEDYKGRFPKPTLGNIEPFNVGQEAGPILQDEYGCTRKATMCPGISRKFADMLYGGVPNWGYGFGYSNIPSVYGSIDSQARPFVVPDAPEKITDSSQKTLSTDYAIRYGVNYWLDDMAKEYISHNRGKKGFPEGCNSAFLDGAIAWYPVDKLGPKGNGVGPIKGPFTGQWNDVQYIWGNFDWLGQYMVGKTSMFWGTKIRTL